MKVMFDSNAFDKLMGLSQEIDFEQRETDYEYYITPIQVEELANIPDEKKEIRVRNFLQLSSMRAILIPVPAIIGYARCGCATVVSEEESDILDQLGNGSTRHIKDDLIGTVAKEQGCTVITNDKKFIKRLNNNEISTMTFEEWLNSLEI